MTWFEKLKLRIKFVTVFVNGKIYATDLIDLGPGWKHGDETSARAYVSNYHPGDKVPVYYDPADPAVGVLEKGVPEFQKLLLIGLAVASAVAWLGAIFVVRSWLRSRRASRTSGIGWSARPAVRNQMSARLHCLVARTPK
jgi:Protein of unknown function (DUF3592)